MALTALVTAQDDPQRLHELTKGAKRILNDHEKELPIVLRQVKLNYFSFIQGKGQSILFVVGNANL